MKEKGILNPQDAELEEAVLGACLVESEAISLVADKLRPEIFYNEQNRMIFAVIQAMFRAGKQIDILTVKNELASCGNLEKVGGPYTLVRLASRVASGAHLEYHACILREMYVRREVILGSYKLLAAASDESVDIADVLAGIHDLLDHLEGEMGTADHLRTMSQLMEDTLAQVEARVEGSRNGITGIPTGFTDLDKLTAGWQRGDLDVIAARPAAGKTAFALHLARAAATAGHSVVVFSLEMQGERLGDRWLVAATEDVDASHLRRGQLGTSELRQVREASCQLSQLPIRVEDSPVISMDHVRSVARMLKSKGGCDMVIVDYLQLCDMKSDQNNRNREQEVAQATRKAKLMAKELDVPVLLLSQLNRMSEGRPDCRPLLSDLRESGAIEQDADMVMLLYRPALHGLKTEHKSKYPSDGLGVVIVAKHRNGETGDVYFGHNPSLTKMGDYIPPDEWLMKHAK
ncbi:replicative DNA helicase [Bacteroides intestinalis]|uniref:Replicative DNA helicase n=1 Tax=Bacteroides intestinalis TaxID=329854 RepID=A0A412XPC1_9BACE|nr:replicative DNA helicase [Bacteroides intestinalis]RGV47015.1 replicative DNA helicase [Bacteroides intestinalis]RHA52252.1 replicative DNA helicase [Bacteroides intestinalis]